MSRRHATGFTIIETMLFLAVSSALAVAILVGVNTSIGTQRYRDAVVSFQTLLQQQYFEVTNVYNQERGVVSCPSGGGSSQYRGQANCVILGRYITVDADGIVTTASVLGHRPTGSASVADDIALLQQYNYGLVPGSSETSSMEWGTRVAWPRSGSGSETTGPRSISVLVLRSPESGMIHTFSRNGADAANMDNLKAMIISTRSLADNNLFGRNQRTLCIDPTGWVNGGRMAVVINTRASSANAIETRSNETLEAMGSTTQC